MVWNVTVCMCVVSAGFRHSSLILQCSSVEVLAHVGELPHMKSGVKCCKLRGDCWQQSRCLPYFALDVVNAKLSSLLQEVRNVLKIDALQSLETRQC